MGIGEHIGCNVGESTGTSGYFATSIPDVEVTGIFVDSTLGANITDGSYSSTNRDNSGSQGNAYTTIQAAVNSMSQSDDIYIRGGTYYENVEMDGSTVPDGTPSNYCSMQSYPSEWAIVDGQNNERWAIGSTTSGEPPESYFLKYWKFERLEVKGGTDGIDRGAAIWWHGGPVIVRYCYIHDNVSSGDGNNSGGLGGYLWDNCTIEYNYFLRNGVPTGQSDNSAHIYIFSEYSNQNSTTPELGYVDGGLVTKSNIIRYNHFDDAVGGFKHKGDQLFTGRNTASPSTDYIDTYKEYGDKIHHNYLVGMRRTGVLLEQDFCQAYNNIFDDCDEAILCNYNPTFQMYNICTYNNTIIDSQSGIKRFGCEHYSFTENVEHWGLDYNNIIDGHNRAYVHQFTSVGINVQNGCSGTFFSPEDLTNYKCAYNYFYQPNSEDAIVLGNTAVETNYYTAVEFEAQSRTDSINVTYKNDYDAGNLLYLGTTGTNRLIVDWLHEIEAGVTTTNGGAGSGSGISHPYLAGVTIPGYIGATNPLNYAWVDGVVNDLTSTTWLAAQTADSTPSWVE